VSKIAGSGTPDAGTAHDLSVVPVIDGWFTDGPEPALIGARCAACERIFFPPTTRFCRNPACSSTEWASVELSRRGRIWSYTDAQYQPPPPYVPGPGAYEPFAIAAVELAEGITVLGQVAAGHGVDELRVGGEVELVVEPLLVDETGVRTVWRWLPIEAGR
jgi:uncharacterized OB-fold protein